jgi:hypothetical protein
MLAIVRSKEHFDKSDEYGDRYRIVARPENERLTIQARIQMALREKRAMFVYSDHAQDRMAERDIRYRDVEHVVTQGLLTQTREYQKAPGRLRECFEGEDVNQTRPLRIVVREELDIVIITVIDLGEEAL